MASNTTTLNKKTAKDQNEEKIKEQIKDDKPKKQDSIAQSYDDMPYESHPFADTSPAHLATISKLFGIETVDITQAKVLELGCASGGNIIPHAARNPKSSYIGIDLSKVQIEDGQAKIKALGLQNVELKHFSISDINKSFGEFDYIIVHGVYSWVPDNVQHDILRICSENLSAKGVAFISYNTYPGWKVKEIIRDAMILRGASHEDPYKKLSHARGMVNFMQEMTANSSIMRSIVDSEINLIRNAAPHYLAHEFLEEYNSPCYFKDFVSAAEKFNLCYLAESEPHTMFVSNLGQQVAAPLLNECGASQVMLEQYMDFLKNRPFRQTILTHKNRANNINYRIAADQIKEFEFCGRFISSEKVELDHIPAQFTTTKGANITISQPIEKAAVMAINESFPAAMNFRKILDAAQKALGSKLPSHTDIIVSLLEQFIIQGLARFTLYPASLCTNISLKPKVEEIVHFDANSASQKGSGVGTANLWHESVRLELVQQHILPKLDGKNSHEQLLEHLVKLAKDGIIQFSKHGVAITDAEQLKSTAKEHLNNALELCRIQGLLIA
jgi:methyltransferase-like protein/2-polyprenyl-3-methyl-5-hydroxy-6-metoxy-1,4-benzoquinol methylase